MIVTLDTTSVARLAHPEAARLRSDFLGALREGLVQWHLNFEVIEECASEISKVDGLRTLRERAEFLLEALPHVVLRLPFDEILKFELLHLTRANPAITERQRDKVESTLLGWSRSRMAVTELERTARSIREEKELWYAPLRSAHAEGSGGVWSRGPLEGPLAFNGFLGLPVVAELDRFAVASWIDQLGWPDAPQRARDVLASPAGCPFIHSFLRASWARAFLGLGSDHGAHRPGLARTGCERDPWLLAHAQPASIFITDDGEMHSRIAPLVLEDPRRVHSTDSLLEGLKSE